MPNQMAALVLAAEKGAVSAGAHQWEAAHRLKIAWISCSCMEPWEKLSSKWNETVVKIEQQAATGIPDMWQEQCMTGAQTTKPSCQSSVRPTV